MVSSKTSANVSKIEMDAAKYRAASQLADGQMPDREIAKQAGVTQRQIDRWKKEPAFAALVRGLIADAADAIRHEAVATKAGRLRILTDTHNKLLQIIEARVEAATRAVDVTDLGGDALRTPRSIWAAGEATGLIVTKETWGKTSSHEAAVDTSLIKSLLDVQERIARELGQFETSVNVKHSGRVDHVVRVPQQLHNLSDDELDALERIALKAQDAEHEVSV